MRGQTLHGPGRVGGEGSGKKLGIGDDEIHLFGVADDILLVRVEAKVGAVKHIEGVQAVLGDRIVEILATQFKAKRQGRFGIGQVGEDRARSHLDLVLVIIKGVF